MQGLVPDAMDDVTAHSVATKATTELVDSALTSLERQEADPSGSQSAAESGPEDETTNSGGSDKESNPPPVPLVSMDVLAVPRLTMW